MIYLLMPRMTHLQRFAEELTFLEESHQLSALSYKHLVFG